MTNVKKIICISCNIIIAISLMVSVGLWIYTRSELEQARRLNVEIQRRIQLAENENSNIRTGLGELEKSVDRNIQSIGEAIELIKTIRSQIMDLQRSNNNVDGCNDNSDSDSVLSK